MHVRERMTRNPVTVRPNDTLAEAAAKIKAGTFRRLPVEEAGKLVGILSEFDFADRRPWLNSVAVKDAMTHRVVTVSPDATLEHASALLSQHEIGALPVVEDGGLVGIITAKDLLMAEPRPLPQWVPARH
jgi:acetoin utilization protein AcuB